jgi:ankyrin repeat protein
MNIQRDFQKLFKYFCKNGHLEYIHKLILSKPEINAGYDYDQLFIIACEYGHLHIVEQLFLYKPDIDNYTANDAFIAACENGYLEIAQRLIVILTNINMCIEHDFPFVVACENGHFEIVEWLLIKNPDICHIADGFDAACNHGHLKIAQFLNDICPPISKHEDFNNTFITSCHCGQIKIAQWMLPILIANNSNSTVTDTIKEACCNACGGGHLHIAKWFLLNYPNINISNGTFNIACYFGHLPVIEWILQKFPNIHITEEAFSLACENDKIIVAKWLLQNKPDIPILDDHFKYACRSGQIEMAQWLQSLNPDKYVILNYDNVTMEITYKINKALVKHPKILYFNHLDNCFICDETVCQVKTHCNHMYCEKCLITWLSRNPLCPYCRSNLSDTLTHCVQIDDTNVCLH